MKKNILFLMLGALTAIAFTGCKNNLLPTRREINQFEMVQAFGVDKCTEDPSEVEVSFISQLEKMAIQNGSGSSKLVTVLWSSGATVFGAERKIKAHSGKSMFFGHADYFLIGEEAAKEDFTKYFDFINRDHEIRLTPKVFIVRGCSAKDFLMKTSSEDSFIADRLKNLDADISVLSNFDQIRIIDVEAMLDNQNAATIIPALKYKDFTNESETGKMPEKDIQTSGYAVLKNFRLVGYIDDTFSRGYNFLTNKVGSCPVSVLDFSGQYVGLEVINSETKVKAHFNGDTLEGVTYTTNVISNIQEQQSREDIFTKSALADLCSKQSEALKGEMQKVIDLSKVLETDCTGLGEKIRMQHPLKWEKIKDNWVEIYPNLNIELDVKSEIERTYDIREPNGYEKESQ